MKKSKRKKSNPLLYRDLERIVQSAFKITPVELYTGRSADCNNARKVLWYVAHNALGVTMLKLSDKFGRSVSTIHYGIHSAGDKLTKGFIEYVEKELLALR